MMWMGKTSGTAALAVGALLIGVAALGFQLDIGIFAMIAIGGAGGAGEGEGEEEARHPLKAAVAWPRPDARNRLGLRRSLGAR